MVLSNPFQTVLEGLLEDIAKTRAGAGPFRAKLSGETDKDTPAPSTLTGIQQLSNAKEPSPVFSPLPPAKPAAKQPSAPQPPKPPRPADTRLAQAGPVTLTDAGPQGTAVASPLPPVKPLLASPNLMKALIKVESNNDPNAISEDGAIGLTQVTKKTGAKPGFGMPTITPEELLDPVKNVKWGKAYLEKFIRRYDGDIQKALIAYNAGFTIADKFDGNVAGLNKETREYLGKIDKELGGGTGLADSKPGFAPTGPETPAGAPTAVPEDALAQTPDIAPTGPFAGSAAIPAGAPRPPESPAAQEPEKKRAPLPPLPTFDLDVPTMAQRRPVVPVIWQQAVAKFQQSRDPEDLKSVPKSSLPAILALMGRVARRRPS